MSDLLRQFANSVFTRAVAYVAGSVGAKLRAMPSVTDAPWLAVGNGVTDNAAAFLQVAADTTGPVHVPAGSFMVSVSAANCAALLALAGRLRCDGSVVFNLAAGQHNLAAQIVFNTPDAQRISVLGAATVNTTLSSQVSTSGAARAHDVVLAVASSAGITAGDWALIAVDVNGTGDFYAHSGGWEVLAVDAGGANRITVRNTHRAAVFPTNTVTGGSVTVLKSRIKWTGSDGIRCEGGQALGLVDRVALIGDYDLAAATGTTGAHGLVLAVPVIVGGANSNAAFNMTGAASLGASVIVARWGEQGIVVAGRCALVANYVASCSNRKRGFYAEGGHIRSKFSIASGNGEDGYISDTTGFIQAAWARASGNGLNGFWATNLSFVSAANSKASGNGSNGYEARGAARMAADSTISLGNAADGFVAVDGGMIDADAALATSNASDGFTSSGNATIDADNASATNNAAFGVRVNDRGWLKMSGTGALTGNGSGAQSVTTNGHFTQPDGSIFPADREGGPVVVYNSARSHFCTVGVSSIGDVTISIDGAVRQTIKTTAGTRIFGATPISAAGDVGLGNSTTTTVGAAGAASAQPATPARYWTVSLDGTSYKVPLHNT